MLLKYRSSISNIYFKIPLKYRSSVSIDNFEHVIAGWEASIF